MLRSRNGDFTRRSLEKEIYALEMSEGIYGFLMRRKYYMWRPLWLFLMCAYSICYFLSSIACLLYRLFKLIITTTIIGSACVAIFAYIYVYPKYVEYREFAVEKMEGTTAADFRINNTSYIYDAKDRLLAKVYENSDLTYLDYEEIPKDVVNAFVAIEDRSFWTNRGFDVYGIVRVGLDYIKTMGKEAHGASTITQQLVRNNFLTREVSLERKGKEILLAYYMSKMYTKEQIMEFYVNNICFANGIYGIEGASEAYFGKKVDKLSLSQIAYLCAIPNSPTYYDPYKYPERALERRNKILKDMKTLGYITQEDYDEAINEKIYVHDAEDEFNDYLASYAIKCAVEYFMQLDEFEFEYAFDTPDTYRDYLSRYNEAYEKAKHELYTGGYKVYTTLDKDIYETLQATLDECLAFNQEINEETGIYSLQGALSVVDNETGKVIALVGGRTQENKGVKGVYTFNRAYQGYRQPGSSFKPIAVYTPAIEYGLTANSRVFNINVDSAKKHPSRVQSMTGEVMTLRSAVEQSKNGVAWQVFDKIGYKCGLDYVSAMQFSKINPLDYNPAASLGGLTTGVTTVEMAGAYCTLSNHGRFVPPTCLRSIKSQEDEELYHNTPATIVYKAKAADDMVDILKGVLTRGTASKLGWYKKTKTEAFCKTGTTNNSKDGWLCGSTPYYSIAVWVGFDTPKPLSSLYGATYPGQIWANSMLALIKDKEVATFKRDKDDPSYSEKTKELVVVKNVPKEDEPDSSYDINTVTIAISNMGIATDIGTLNALYATAMAEVSKITDPSVQAMSMNNANVMYATMKQKIKGE